MKLRKKILYLIMLNMVFLLAGCSLKKDPSIQKDNVEMNESTTNQDSEESYLVPGPNSYDSADTVVVVKKNTKIMSLVNGLKMMIILNLENVRVVDIY